MTASDVLLPQAATFGAGAGVGALGASFTAALVSVAPSFAGAAFFASPDDFASLDLGPHDDPGAGVAVALSVACNHEKIMGYEHRE